jgi:hypothetical protein
LAHNARRTAVLHLEELDKRREDDDEDAKPEVDADPLTVRVIQCGHEQGQSYYGERKETI